MKLYTLLRGAVVASAFFCSVSIFAQGTTTDPITGEEWYQDEWVDDYPYHEGEGYDSPESPVAVTDGNPIANTAQAARVTTEQAALLDPVDLIDEGFTPDEPAATDTGSAGDEGLGGTGETEATAAAAGGKPDAASVLGAEIGVGTFEIGGVDASLYTLTIPYSHKLTDRGTLSLQVPLSITNLEDVMATFDNTGNLRLDDASIYGGGLNVAYSHKVYMKADKVPYRWKVTPSAGLFLRESSDLNMGSWVFNAGLSSSFAYQFKPGWVINLGNSISFAWSRASSGYPDPIRDSQQVLTNGIQLLRLSGRWTYHAYIVDTRMLRDSLVDAYQTYAFGAGYKVTRSHSLRFSVIYDHGDDFSSLRGTLGSTWKF